MDSKQAIVEENKDVSDSMVEDVFDNSADLSKEEVETISKFVDGVTVEKTIEVPEVYSGDESSNEKLIPTFKFSSPLPFVVRPKGHSKSNPSKGKRPRNMITLDEIDGDLCTGLDTSKQTQGKLLYKLARESQRAEFIRRTKTTLLVRIEEMNEKKLITLADCVNIFMREYVPISLTLPSLLSENALSDLLKVDPDSSFIHTLSESKQLQDVMRKAILESKNLNVCCCGYVYVHPMLTYAKHPTDSTLAIGKQPYTEKITSVKRSEVVKNLNSLRYYLEILYEYYNT
jgi:hypothetical protein